jgi:outer membrane protein
MKKVLIALCFVVLSWASFGQISQGTILIGGSSNLGFNSFNEDAGDYTQFILDVRGGYFVIDNLAVGLNLGFSSVDFGDGKETDTQFGIFGRYYVNGKIFAGLGYNSIMIKYEDDFSDDESTVSVIPIEIGYAAFINDAVAIEPALNYRIFDSDADGAAFGVSVGVTVYLGRGE